MAGEGPVKMSGKSSAVVGRADHWSGVVLIPKSPKSGDLHPDLAS